MRQFRASFDPHLGYPVEVDIDFDRNIADDELSILVPELSAH